MKTHPRPTARPRQADGGPGGDNQYARRLAAEAEGRAGEPKRARTRARLKAAAVRLMDRVGHTGLTVTGIAHEAGVAAGTFYTHFPDLESLTLEILSEFLEEEVRPASPLSATEEPFEAMRAAFVRIVPLVRANTGLFRAVFGLKDENPAVLALWKRATEKWVDALAEGARRHCDAAGVDPRYYRFLGHATSAMVDEVLFRILIERFEGLIRITEDDGELAELLAVLRYRMLFAANPDPARLTVAAPLARIAIAPRGAEAGR